MNRPTFSMRRLLALVIALIMFAALLAGCGKDDTEDTSGSSEPSGTTEQTAAPTDEPTAAPTDEPTEAPTDPVVTVPTVTVGTVNADNLNVRAEPYTTADILKRLAINTRVEIQEQKIVDGVNWGRISEGWINMNYVTIDSNGSTGTGTGTNTNTNTGTTGTQNENNIDTGGTTGTITATELHIRKSADADSASLGTYKKGDKVTVVEKNGNWGKTDKGWISLKYVDLDGTVTNDTTSKDDNKTSTGTDDTVVTNGKSTILGYGTVKGASSLAVRTGPGTKYTQVSFIRLGDTVAYYQKSGNWVRIKSGWVSASYLDMGSSIAVGSKGTINTAELNIRKEASSSSDKVGTYKKGDTIEVLEVSGNWCRTDKGWISLNYVSFTSGSSSTSSNYTTGTGVITATSLHIRESADENAKSLGTYSKDDKVTVTEISGKWGKTDKGWISMKYVKMDADTVGGNTTYKTGTATVVVNTTLTIRKEAKSSSDKVGSYANGDKVTITEVSGSWGKTDKGWISLNYVKFD